MFRTNKLWRIPHNYTSCICCWCLRNKSWYIFILQFFPIIYCWFGFERRRGKTFRRPHIARMWKLIARGIVIKTHVLIVTIMSAYYDCAFMRNLPLRDIILRRCQTLQHHAVPLSREIFPREKLVGALCAGICCESKNQSLSCRRSVWTWKSRPPRAPQG